MKVTAVVIHPVNNIWLLLFIPNILKPSNLILNGRNAKRTGNEFHSSEC